jgi:hypothetical protein
MAVRALGIERVASVLDAIDYFRFAEVVVGVARAVAAEADNMFMLFALLGARDSVSCHGGSPIELVKSASPRWFLPMPITYAIIGLGRYPAQTGSWRMLATQPVVVAPTTGFITLIAVTKVPH